MTDKTQPTAHAEITAPFSADLRRFPALSEQDAGLLEQAASMLEGLHNDERNRGNCSAAEGAACSADAVRRLAVQLLRSIETAQCLHQGAEPDKHMTIGRALREGLRAEPWISGGLGASACVGLCAIQLQGWWHTAETAKAYADAYNRGADDMRAALQAAPPAPAAVPVLYVSPAQLEKHLDLDGAENAEAGRYLPARKTLAGKFTQPLYAHAPAPAAVAVPAPLAAGMKVAADLVQEQADLYIAEHAETDPDTGAVTWHHREYGFDWHNGLEELAQQLLARAALTAAPAQAVAQGINIDFKQATELLEMFGGEPAEITLMTGDGHSGNGLYASYTDMPEEGAEFLGTSDDEALPAAPAQEHATQLVGQGQAYSIDADPEGIRARVAEAITSALASGVKKSDRPSHEHWLRPFWMHAYFAVVQHNALRDSAEAMLNAPGALTQAARDLLAERARQVDAKGFNHARDDNYSGLQLAGAAASYLILAAGGREDDARAFWPWRLEWLKPGDRRRYLEKAGALVLAELERLDRASAHAAQGGE